MYAVRPDETEIKIVQRQNGTGRRWNYFGIQGGVDMEPQGFMVERPYANAVIAPHFHDVDQFQVVVMGDGRIGKKKVAPITFQYADAFTPYGPIVANQDGIAFLTLRPVASGGHWGMPGNKQNMPCRAGRNIDGAFNYSDKRLAEGEVERQSLMAEQEDGVAAAGLRLGPNASAEGFGGNVGGQYYVVCAGTLVLGGKEYPELSLLHYAPEDGMPTFTAGADGAEILMVQFAAPSDRPGTDTDYLQKRTTYVNHLTAPAL